MRRWQWFGFGCTTGALAIFVLFTLLAAFTDIDDCPDPAAGRAVTSAR